MCFIYIIDYLLIQLLEILNPSDKIERALDASNKVQIKKMK